MNNVVQEFNPRIPFRRLVSFVLSNQSSTTPPLFLPPPALYQIKTITRISIMVDFIKTTTCICLLLQILAGITPRSCLCLSQVSPIHHHHRKRQDERLSRKDSEGRRLAYFSLSHFFCISLSD